MNQIKQDLLLRVRILKYAHKDVASTKENIRLFNHLTLADLDMTSTIQ